MTRHPVPDETALTHNYPPDARAAVTALRQAASRATSLQEWRQHGRYATPEEIALAESLRKPFHCAGHSSRTGLACTLPRVRGMTVCRRHGGAIARVKEKARQRLAAMVDPMLGRMQELALQDDHKPSAVNAARDILSRAGVGEEAEHRRQAGQRGAGDRIVVRIGFLNACTEVPVAPVTLEATPVRNNE